MFRRPSVPPSPHHGSVSASSVHGRIGKEGNCTYAMARRPGSSNVEDRRGLSLGGGAGLGCGGPRVAPHHFFHYRHQPAETAEPGAGTAAAERRLHSDRSYGAGTERRDEPVRPGGPCQHRGYLARDLSTDGAALPGAAARPVLRSGQLRLRVQFVRSWAFLLSRGREGLSGFIVFP